MNVLIWCKHTGIGNLIMFLQAIREWRLEHRFNWYHNSSHFNDQILFARNHIEKAITEEPDYTFVLYPNFFELRKINYKPLIGFKYKIKGIGVKFGLDKALKFNNNKSEIYNNMDLIELWLRSYSPLDRTRTIN